MKNAISILKMTNSEARNFFLQPQNYFSLNLPSYFDLSYLLNFAKDNLGVNQLFEKNHLMKESKYSKVSGINYILQSNKTSSSYRPIVLIHPFLYVDYVNCLTKEEHWNEIIKRFEELHRITESKIYCGSIPFEIRDIKRVLDTDYRLESAIKFWSDIEQESIKLSLAYSYLLKVDIASFYSSIYTHTIPWALHGEAVAKEQKENRSYLGNKLDGKFQHMNYGETVGIPQGNLVSDFISELLLAYIDSLLVEQLEKINSDLDYKILRYRDDFRIFTHTAEEANLIKRELVLILQRHKLTLGEAKSSLGMDITKMAIKEEKLYWLEHDPTIKITIDRIYQLPKKFFEKVFLKNYGKKSLSKKWIHKIFKRNFHNRIYSATLQKHLYIIKLFSDKFPNNGQLIGAFKEFEDRISELTYEDFKHSGTEINVLIALVVDILKKNPKVTEVGTKLLSVLLSKIHYNISFEDWVRLWEENKTVTEDYELKLELINSINQKLSASMYHSYLEIWLQRLVVKALHENSSFIESYMGRSNNELVILCNSAIRNESIPILFDESWLHEKYRLDLKQFINLEEIENLPEVISAKEISLAEYSLII